jgi:hypothetical protein
MWTRLRLITASALLVGACGDDPCDPAANTGCDDNQACERVQGSDPTCVAAVVVVGRVFDLDPTQGSVAHGSSRWTQMELR